MDTTTQYYDKESSSYSHKRYDGQLLTYVQFLFRQRLSIFLDYLTTILSDKTDNLSLIEIGCADGIIIRKVLEYFPERWERIVGLDISEEMLKEARRRTNNPLVFFQIRNGEGLRPTDIVIRLGVHTPNLEEEIEYIKKILKPGGYVFYSVGSKKSLHVRFKLKNAPYVKDYLTYNKYDERFSKEFDLVNSKVYGFFVPKLWTFPNIARVVQPIFEFIFRHFTPELYHEKIYLLRLKR